MKMPQRKKNTNWKKTLNGPESTPFIVVKKKYWSTMIYSRYYLLIYQFAMQFITTVTLLHCSHLYYAPKTWYTCIYHKITLFSDILFCLLTKKYVHVNLFWFIVGDVFLQNELNVHIFNKKKTENQTHKWQRFQCL